MTKLGVALAGLLGLPLLLALLVPSAAAHGAPEAREIDTRSVEDYTGAGDYGLDGLLEEGPDDLLVVDIREAYDATSGEPAVYFRTIIQRESSLDESRKNVLEFQAGGADHEYWFAPKGDSATHNFDALVGPIEVGDGHPKAFDAVLKYSTLGVSAGDVLTDIKMTSHYGSVTGDVMPGTWYYKGYEVPSYPTDDSAGTSSPYELKGPAELLTATYGVHHVDVSLGTEGTATLTVTNALTQMTQFVEITATASEGFSAALGTASMNLGTGAGAETQDVDLQVTRSAAYGDGEVVAVAVSDLGGRVVLRIPVVGPAAPQATVDPNDPHAQHRGDGEEDEHDEHEQGHDHDDHSHGLPSVGPGLALLGVALVILARRRR